MRIDRIFCKRCYARCQQVRSPEPRQAQPHGRVMAGEPLGRRVSNPRKLEVKQQQTPFTVLRRLV